MDIPIQIYQVILRFAEINFGSASSRIFYALVEKCTGLLTPDQDGLSASLESKRGNGTEEIRFKSLIPAAVAAGLDHLESTYFRSSASLTPLTPNSQP